MVQMNGNMVDVCAPTDEPLLVQLAAALERAVKAEKAFLRLKKETFDEKIKNDIRIAEKEYLDKTKLYSSIPDQMRRIQSEFQKESAELVAQRDSAEKVYNYCIEGLNLGLTMDQLPLTTENADDVKQMIKSKLQAKKMPSMAANVTNGGTQNIRNNASVNESAPPNQAGRHHPPGPISMPSATSNMHYNDRPYYSTGHQVAQQKQLSQLLKQQQSQQQLLLQQQQQQRLQQQQVSPYQHMLQQQQKLIQQQQQQQQQQQKQLLQSQQQQQLLQSQQQQQMLQSQQTGFYQLPNNGGAQKHQVVTNSERRYPSPVQLENNGYNLNQNVQGFNRQPSQYGVNRGTVSEQPASQYAQFITDKTVTNPSGGRPAAAGNSPIDNTLTSAFTQPPSNRASASPSSSIESSTVATSQVSTQPATSADPVTVASQYNGHIPHREVHALDDFVIDDDMFGQPQEAGVIDKAVNGSITNHNGNSSGINNDIASSRTESVSPKFSDVIKSDAATAPDENETDGSGEDDDEKFAREYANKQGSKKLANKKAIAPGPAAPSKPTASTESNSKPRNTSPENMVNWDEEPFFTIVTQLASKYKVKNGAAKNALEASASAAGGVTDLDVVFAEAEQRIRFSLKPAPVQQKTVSASSSSTSVKSGQSTSGGQSASGGVSSSASNGKKMFSNFKTALCNNYARDKKCPNGEYCTFAHGKGELRHVERPQGANGDAPSPHSYYKVMLCKYFETGNGCQWGSDCIFAHGVEDLRKPGEGPPKKSPRSVDEETGLHEEPCDNQQCPGKLEFLLRKTGLCVNHNKGLCKFGKECKYAHSKREQKKMPKWEMCQRHQQRKCIHSRNPEKCVYAHTKEELKKKPLELEKKGKKPISGATGGRLIPAGRKYVPWAGNDKHPDSSRDVEECLICMAPLGEKKTLLDCGHNKFHEKCISQWVNEGAASCPVCRQPAKLPDLFQAPAGFKPEEFPGLGLYY